MSAPAAFHDDFVRALYGIDAPESSALAALANQPGFAVYRNTVLKACIDALRGNYPTVIRLVGDEWFDAAAAIYARRQPPTQATLLYYGEDFADFLAGFEPAADLPYLPGVARLDRLWTQAHVAADDTALAPDKLAALAPGELSALRIRPHVAARWIRFHTQPVYTIWRRNRESETCGDIDWRSEGALLTRPRDSVRWCALDKAGHRFLDACTQGCSLVEAVDAVLNTLPGADIARTLAALLAAGALSLCKTENPA